MDRQRPHIEYEVVLFKAEKANLIKPEEISKGGDDKDANKI